MCSDLQPIFRFDLISNENLFTSKLIQAPHKVNSPFSLKSGLPCQVNQTWIRGKCANNSKKLFQSNCGSSWIHVIQKETESSDKWRKKSVSEHRATCMHKSSKQQSNCVTCSASSPKYQTSVFSVFQFQSRFYDFGFH